MLIILLGVSGVGKSAIIEKLGLDYGWNRLSVYTTREHRKDDIKINVSEITMDQMIADGDIGFENECYGKRYAIDLKKMNNAIKSNSEYWISDFSLENWGQLKKNSNIVGIAILIENQKQLQYHLEKSGRNTRCFEALNEYEKHYNNIHNGWNNTVNVYGVVNSLGKLNNSCDEIVKLSISHFQKPNEERKSELLP